MAATTTKRLAQIKVTLHEAEVINSSVDFDGHVGLKNDQKWFHRLKGRYANKKEQVAIDEVKPDVDLNS